MSFFNDIKAVLTPKDIIFKEMHQEDSETYSFIFEKELKTFSKEDNIRIEFFTNREKLIEKLKEMSLNNKETTYFLAGAKQMTASIKSILLEQSVKKKNIKVDTFFGY